jgi:hypothetical protein
MPTLADNILNTVYNSLQIQNLTDEEKYSRINQIVPALQQIHDETPINGKTTGTISERLCELALRARVPHIYRNISDRWNWMADFSILGHPFNLLVSVKSFKAKERLLVSGSGNILSPTIGWGLMNDANEWTESRTRTYLFRSFIAIYLPTALYDAVSQDARSINNINGKPFLRKVEDFMDNLTNSVHDGVIDISAF